MNVLSWAIGFNRHYLCFLCYYRLRNVEKFVEFYFMYFRLSYSSKTKTFCKCICGTNLHTFDFKILTYIFHVCKNHANQEKKIPKNRYPIYIRTPNNDLNKFC